MTQEEIKDMAMCGETSTVQFKQEFTGQKEIAREMIAFANSHGGRIFFGIADKTGEITGLRYEEIQLISRELGNAANEQVKPTIYIETEVVRVDGKHVLVCSVAEGRNKPYKNLQGEIWVKQGADKRRITENTEILALFQDSGSYRPEEDGEKGSSIKDLEMAYVREYFETTYGKEIEDFDQPLDSMLRSLSVLNQKGEVTRMGMLFFGKNPQLFEPSVVVKAVAFAGNDIGDTNYLDSRDITGTLPRMFKEGMAFMKSYLRHEQKGQNFNSLGILEIPEVVLEELLQNALVHFDLLHHAAIRLLVFTDRIEIVNPGNLYGGLKVDDIKLGVSRQRNPLMAGFAARTMIYRGLGSGIKRVVRENIRIDFDNEESANQFKVTVWRVARKNYYTVPKEISAISKVSESTQKFQESTQKTSKSTQKSTDKTSKSTQKMLKSTQKASKSTQKPLDNIRKSTQKQIIEIIKENPRANRKEIAERIGKSEDGVKKQLANLKRMGLIERVGADRGGYWRVISQDK